MRVDQLRHVLVAGRDQHLQARVHGALRQRADDVVGLDARNPQQRQAQRLHGVDQRLDLRAQVVRHGRPVRLVLGKQFVAERLARRVEHDGDQFGVLLALHAQQHVEHAEHGTRRLAARVGQRRQCVEGPVQVRRAIHEHQCARVNHRGRCLDCRRAVAEAECARPWAASSPALPGSVPPAWRKASSLRPPSAATCAGVRITTSSDFDGIVSAPLRPHPVAATAASTIAVNAPMRLGFMICPPRPASCLSRAPRSPPWSVAKRRSAVRLRPATGCPRPGTDHPGGRDGRFQ